MPDLLDDSAFRKRMERIESLLHAVEESSDPQVQARTREIVETLLELHGAALERLLTAAAGAGAAGQALIDAAAADELVGSVLLLHNLHPLDLESRVRSQGGDVELLGVADGVVRLRIQKSDQGCHSTGPKLRAAVEAALTDRAPDAVAVEIEEAAVLIPAAELLRRNGRHQ
ncbi:MAG TPA: NifU family protein [Gemmataceae bacterium]|nr:NifU family protein [Gemmataceae bacterium]